MCKSTYTWYDWIINDGDQLHEQNHDNMTVYFLKSGGIMYIVIRGTDDFWDWLYNIRVGTLLTEGVHEGTHLLYNKIRPFVLDHVHKNWCPKECCHLVVGGHSMGGMVATLLLRELVVAEKMVVSAAATFGTPSPFSYVRGRQEKDEAWCQNLVQYINGNDIVPRILNWRQNYPVGLVKQIGDPGWHRFWSIFSDHDMARYVESMNEIYMAHAR